jgi:hypothetical protein
LIKSALKAATAFGDHDAVIAGQAFAVIGE